MNGLIRAARRITNRAEVLSTVTVVEKASVFQEQAGEDQTKNR